MAESVGIYEAIVSAHRRILGMASVVCVLVKICLTLQARYRQTNCTI